MKALALILTFYISFLTVQPVATHLYNKMAHKTEKSCCGMCCKKDSKCRKGEEDKSCCMNVCSGFSGCCFYYISGSDQMSLSDNMTSNTWSIHSGESTTSGFLAEQLQPPELG